MHSVYAERFQAEGVRFTMRDRLMLIEVENEHAKAMLTTHGGSVLSFFPKNQTQDLLWVSPTAVFNGNKAVRGGIPVCWPWFGKASSPELPAHGFVRNRVWQLDGVSNRPGGVTEVLLSCHDDEKTRTLWPHRFDLQLKVEIGEKLALSLTTYNPNDYDIEITEALHTYFHVSQVEGLTVEGLEGAMHLDKLEQGISPETQLQPLVVAPPIDSVYLDQAGDVAIEDGVASRRILIEKRNSASSVVWNPGPEIVRGFADIPDDAWPGFVCVESGNVLDNAVLVPSEQKHTLSVLYSVV